MPHAEIHGFQILLTGPMQMRVILEVAILNVRAGQNEAFEAAFREASAIIASMPGYEGHELRHCLEAESRYLLLVKWQRLEDHVIGFRQAAAYQKWRALLHHFYDPFPTVEHYGEPVVANAAPSASPR